MNIREGKAMEQRMIANVRRFFPEATIWVDTWDHSRPFWQAMVDQGYIDFIGNDYAWPCLIRIVSFVIRTESTKQGDFNQRKTRMMWKPDASAPLWHLSKGQNHTSHFDDLKLKHEPDWTVLCGNNIVHGCKGNWC